MADYSFIPQEKSIHIVVFTGGCYPEPQLTASYWKNRRPEYVIAADSGLETAEKYARFFSGTADFTPRNILGDFDSLTDKTALSRYPRESIGEFPSDKDWTDTELAFECSYAAAGKRGLVPYITLVGGDGGRTDHLLALYDSFAAVHRADAWLLAEQALYYLADGTEAAVSGLQKKDTVSVARTSASRSGGTIVSHGFKWESSVFRSSGMPSLSNRIADSYEAEGRPVTLSVRGTSVLLIVPYTVDVTFRATETL
jgi:thiamine pyrophosphokinase